MQSIFVLGKSKNPVWGKELPSQGARLSSADAWERLGIEES